MIPRLAASALFLSVAGCMAPMDEGTPPPTWGAGSCEAGPAQALVGQPATAELGAEAMRLSGARTLRWIQPGQAVTMDFRNDRLNIKLDAENRVEAITCG